VGKAPQGRSHFPTTRWTLIRAARAGDPQARRALSELCGTYWYPLYGFARKKGYSPDDAADLTQAFFARLLEKRDLDAVDPRFGHFSSWLLASMTHFLHNAWDKERAKKRGGDATPVSIDAAAADRAWQRETATDLTPEKLYDRMLTLQVMERAQAALSAEYAARGESARYEALKGAMTGELTARYAEIARTLGLSDVAVRQAARRLRLRFSELLREEVAELVADPAEVEAEVGRMLASLA
jgi:RNA polymerase sigma factor (sigma-70 family)